MRAILTSCLLLLLAAFLQSRAGAGMFDTMDLMDNGKKPQEPHAATPQEPPAATPDQVPPRAQDGTNRLFSLICRGHLRWDYPADSQSPGDDFREIYLYTFDLDANAWHLCASGFEPLGASKSTFPPFNAPNLSVATCRHKSGALRSSDTNLFLDDNDVSVHYTREIDRYTGDMFYEYIFPSGWHKRLFGHCRATELVPLPAAKF
jgi:hypothetical protein